MKSSVSFTATVLLLGVFLTLVLFFFSPLVRGTLRISSPLPDFLTRSLNDQVATAQIFLPNVDRIETLHIAKPVVLAKAALVYDLTTGKTLFAKEPKLRLPIASLTKIATAVLAIEQADPNDRYVVAKDNLVGEDSMGLSEGEVLTLEQLLYGLMLASGNDAAETLASNFPHGRNEFIKAMNKKVASLGLADTHFTNPSGLEGDGTQYATAYDLLVMTHYALFHLPLFAKVVSVIEYSIPYSKDHKAFFLQNETNLLTSYPGVKGVKTGYTEEAGLCLVTYLDYKGHKIIGVLLGSNNRRAEMRELLNYSLLTLGVTPP